MSGQFCKVKRSKRCSVAIVGASRPWVRTFLRHEPVETTLPNDSLRRPRLNINLAHFTGSRARRCFQPNSIPTLDSP